MKASIILGTRPEIIKMSPVVKALESGSIDYFILHTGQHYDYEMDKIFFEELGLRPPSKNLNVGSGMHAVTTGKMIVGIEEVLIEEKPNVVLVEGDTNSVLAGALVSTKLHISLGHVEAGLRSYDRRMPEEYNRIIADHSADYLFAPTQNAKKNLEKEGISNHEILYYGGVRRQKISVTGNTSVDALQQNLEKAKKTDALSKYGLSKDQYFLVTAHRAENVDEKHRLSGILNGLVGITALYNKPIIYPIHPRTKRRIKEFNLESEVRGIRNLNLVEPTGFFDMLALEYGAKLILTDSGGIQEEACTLKVPCVVLRDSSDRPESIEVGAAMLAGCETKKIIETTKKMIDKERNWENPYGEGKAGEKIVEILKKEFL